MKYAISLRKKIEKMNTIGLGNALVDVLLKLENDDVLADLLTYDKQFELRDQVAALYKKCQYPTTLADLDIKADEVDSIVDAAPALTEWTCVPEPMTKEVFKKAIMDADEFGRSL